MAEVAFTTALQRHVRASTVVVPGETVREVLEAALAAQPAVRGYVLDDQGRLRHHVAIFLNGVLVADRERLSDPVRPDAEVYVTQALSGG
jgi:hypothetical protein